MARLKVLRFADRDEAEAHYLREVDRLAEEERGKYITPGPGQAMTYEAKHREALAGDGPILQAEAQALGVTVAEVAQSVLDAHAAWLTIGATIEAERLKAKRDVRESSTPAEMHNVVKGLDFTVP